jgi:L-fuculose-phosphate aldolase/L-ribulose-5-phosphate 4-epimerase
MRGLQTNSGGNISARSTTGDYFYVKPSGVGFGELQEEDLVAVDLAGEVLRGTRKPSQDTNVHLAIYKARPEVNAVVHVHSPWATGWACAGRQIPCLTFQMVEKLGSLPFVPTAPGGGQQTADEVIPALSDPAVNGALLENHGTIGLGKTMLAALHAVEIIEETAHVAAVKEMLAR